MRIPDCGPFGDTFFEARARAMVDAFFLNRPFGGYVDTVLTFATQPFVFLRATDFLGLARA